MPTIFVPGQYAVLACAVEHVASSLHRTARHRIPECGQWAEHRRAAQEALGLTSILPDQAWPVEIVVHGDAGGLRCGECRTVVHGGRGPFVIADLSALLDAHLSTCDGLMHRIQKATDA